MELTWLGTAGFRIKTDKYTFFIDPYLSRNDKALPRRSLKPSDIQDGDVILISHGHFDHIYGSYINGTLKMLNLMATNI